MAGLLDFLNTDDARLGIGLLAAAGPSMQPVGFGQRLQGALGSFDEYKKDQARAKYFDTQAQTGLLGLEKAKREAAVQQQMTDAARQFYRSPQEAEALSAGPGASQVRPGFDLSGYGSKLFEIDPLKALSFQQALAKESPFSKVDPKDYTPESLRAFAASGGRDFTQLQPRVKREVGPGGQVYDPYSVQPGQTLVDPNKPFAVVDNQLVPNKPYQQYEIGKAGAGAARINVNTEKNLLGDVAGGLGKSLVEARTGAQSALSTISTVGRLLDALDTGKVMAGPGTTFRQYGLQVGNLLGVSGKDANEKMLNTRQAIQSLAQLELDAAQQMKGQGQITEAERSIIRRAASGDIESMTAGELRLLGGVLDRSARTKIQGYNSQIKPLLSNPNAAPIAPFLSIEEPAARQGSGGVRRFNPATGRIE